MQHKRLIAVVGPTAVGKSALGVALALELGGEVVSADSRQVYRGLDLGTGKITPSETRGVPHHLIDVADPSMSYTASNFVRDGRAAIDDMVSRSKIPILVGGTGFYADALLERASLDEVPPDPELRERLSMSDIDMLQRELKELDPERYTTIDIKNPRRLMRAIEIALHREAKPRYKISTEVSPRYDTTWIGLTLHREELKQKIHTRLIARLDVGMLDEARQLHERGLSYERMEQLGLEYRYMARHLQGQISYDQMVETLDAESFKYAKRQMTWFKKNKEIRWFDADDPTLPRQVLALWS